MVGAEPKQSQKGIIAMSTANDSHISKPSKGNETPPLPQHKRMALGQKVNGQSNPNGGKGSTTNKVANGNGKTF